MSGSRFFLEGERNLGREDSNNLSHRLALSWVIFPASLIDHLPHTIGEFRVAVRMGLTFLEIRKVVIISYNGNTRGGKYTDRAGVS